MEMVPITYLYPHLSVIAIRARARSSGYVTLCEVMPANEPARKRRKCGSFASSTFRSIRYCSNEANWQAEYGMILARVAVLPR